MGDPGGDSSTQTAPQLGTYVVQIPKDQVYRVPPLENATLYKHYTTQKPRRNCCRFCLAVVVSLLLISTIAALVFYFVFRPESPNYSVHKLAFKSFNLTALSPEINVSFRADNPNRKIGIYYERESSVDLFYGDVKLCDGALPAFYQPKKNVTELETRLTGSGIRLMTAVLDGLVAAQRQGKVAMKLHVIAPVRIKVGSIKTWTITVKVDCDLTVDKLTPEAKIVSKDCNYGVDLW